MRLTKPSRRNSDQNPAFSPDGTDVLFTRFTQGYNDGPSSLYVLDMMKHTIRLLTGAPDSDNVNLPGSSWNAATYRIVFSSDRQDIDEIWSIRPDGSDLLRVTIHPPPLYYVEPSFSPDGAWIVFEVIDPAPDERAQGSIWKIRSNGSALVQLTGGVNSERDDRQPNWSPFGDRILFQRRIPGSDDWNIYSMAPDGSDIRQITTQPSSDTDASWSPNGMCIVYSSDYGDLAAPKIFIMVVDTGFPIQITASAQHADSAPSWSPDGRWIVFESKPIEQESSPSSLWLIAVTETICQPSN